MIWKQNFRTRVEISSFWNYNNLIDSNFYLWKILSDKILCHEENQNSMSFLAFWFSNEF